MYDASLSISLFICFSSQVELQRKLLEIARPTPLNQQAIQRMGQRKSNEDNQQNLIGKNKLWVFDTFCFSCTVRQGCE
jgi:hypothetical protein